MSAWPGIRRRDLAERMGGPDKIRRQHEAGRLTVRERLAALLDEDSFHEIGALAGAAVYDGDGELADFRPANFVTGTGRIDGRKIVVGGDDFTIRGGAADAAIAGKQVYAEQLANQLRLPLVRLVEGTGGGGGGSVKMLEQMGHTYVPVNPGWDYVVDNLSIRARPGRCCATGYTTPTPRSRSARASPHSAPGPDGLRLA